VRDKVDLAPLECTSCGLVRLSSFSHIDECFYSDSHMHDSAPCEPQIVKKVGDEDDIRRFHDFYPLFDGKSLLDFGCGSGGFLSLSKTRAASVMGLEPDKGWSGVHQQLGIPVTRSLGELPAESRFDVISMFHVLEHISNPLPLLSDILNLLSNDGKGRLLVEVPSANDALLTLYENRAFSEFTYWSCHLYLHTPDTLRTLMEKAGFRTLEMRQYQRYPLANHLYWLAHGRPGGQEMWKHLVDAGLNAAYARVLAEQGRCDTIIGIFAGN
jgi:2-polyprenyl-3-methyl-5-hydroxy-6-metoxy-1,4-benzoquinol methylase